MNKVVLMGRLTRDPDIRYTQSETPLCIARYTLAVDRRFKRDGEPTADFINCVSFGKSAEFTEKYFCKGMRVTVSGRIQTGSYEKDGQKIYTTDVVVEEQEFADSKAANDEIRAQSGNSGSGSPAIDEGDGFINIPEGIEEGLPFGD